mmetsp:Transcript_156531/g.502329  ORF Transcript_156531/g.502329 Transcript_156531/m.502329 type:complete len:223 (-) Transcript_156531:522-1190(-)
MRLCACQAIPRSLLWGRCDGPTDVCIPSQGCSSGPSSRTHSPVVATTSPAAPAARCPGPPPCARPSSRTSSCRPCRWRSRSLQPRAVARLRKRCGKPQLATKTSRTLAQNVLWAEVLLSLPQRKGQCNAPGSLLKGLQQLSASSRNTAWSTNSFHACPSGTSPVVPRSPERRRRPTDTPDPLAANGTRSAARASRPQSYPRSALRRKAAAPAGARWKHPGLM